MYSDFGFFDSSHFYIHDKLETKLILKIVKMPKLFPYIELGDEAAEPIVFLAGFPDDQLSAFGPLIDKLKSNHRILTLCFPDFDIKHGSQQLKPRPWGACDQSSYRTGFSSFLSLLVVAAS